MKAEFQRVLPAAIEAAASRQDGTLDLTPMEVGRCITPDAIPEIASAIRDNPFLTQLDLSGHLLGMEGAVAIANVASELKSLVSFRLSDTGLTPAGMRAIAQSASFEYLTKLDVGHNSLGPDGAGALADLMMRSPTLTSLSACGNDIDDEGAELLAPGIASCTRLEEIDLSFNGLGDRGAAAVANSLAQLRNLKLLDLNWNDIGGFGMSALCARASDTPQLKALLLWMSPIGPGGARALAKAARHWPSLQDLDLGGSNIGSAGAIALAEASQYFGSLHRLHLRKSNIGTEGACAIIEALRRRPWKSSLGELSLRLNPLPLIPTAVLGSEKAHVWREYGDQIATEGRIFLNDVKLVILGEAATGKTHLRNRLNHSERFYFDAGEPRTHGIDSSTVNVESRIDNITRTLKVRIWDFGGQSFLHASHRFFLTPIRTVFAIVCDSTKTREENRLDYWIQLVRREASPACPIIIVVTKCDLHDKHGGNLPARLQELDVTELRSANGLPSRTFLHVVRHVGWAKYTDRFEPGWTDNRARSRAHQWGLRDLHRAIRSAACDVLDIASEYPPSFQEALRWLEDEAFRTVDGMPCRIISITAVRQACQEFGLEQGLIDVMLKTAHSLGIVHYLGFDPRIRSGEMLSELVFNSEWVRWPVYAVLRASSESTRGILTWEQLERILPDRPSHANDDKAGRMGFAATDRVRLIDLMVACDLIFELRRGTGRIDYFVPDHLQPRRCREYPAGRYVWKRQFEWLPESAFSRLLGRLCQQCTEDPAGLWRDEIVVSLGSRAQLTLRWLPITRRNEDTEPFSSEVIAAIDGCTEQEAVRLIDLLDAELRAILGEPLLGPVNWIPLNRDERPQVGAETSPLPEYAIGAAQVYYAVRSVCERESIEILSWDQFLNVAKVLLISPDCDPDLAGAIRIGLDHPETFKRYCRNAGLNAWWSMRGKRRSSRSAVDWADNPGMGSRGSDSE